MSAVVTIEGFALVLLGLLVAGLLRSHAEILRRLATGETTTEPPLETEVGVALPRENKTPAFDVTGVTLDGATASLGIVGAPQKTIVGFLSSGCLTCAEFWTAFADGDSLGIPDDTRLVIVTKGADQESPAKLRNLAPDRFPVVMSTEAWEDYSVPVAPYFIYVDGQDGVIGEGAAATWPQITNLLLQASEDVEFLKAQGQIGKRRRRRRPRKESGDARELRADAELLAAGFVPGDSRLYDTPPLAGVGESDD